MNRAAHLLLATTLLLASCASRQDELEALVRSDENLSRLAGQVRDAVAAARQIADPPAGPGLEEEQEQWRARLAECLDAEDPALCVGEAHRERLEELRARFALDPREVARFAARQAGFDFLAFGNEPGWSLRLSPTRAEWVTDYGQTRHLVDDLGVERVGETTIHRGRLDGRPFSVEVRMGPCQDDMSGEEFTLSFVVRHGEQQWRGCGDRLTD